MVNLLKSLFFSSTAKDSLIMLFGAALSTIVGFFITIILTRNFGASEFGLFITALVFTQLMADSFELGINSSVLNFVSSAQLKEKLIFIKVTFISKITIALVLSICSYIFASQIAALIFRNDSMTPLLKISAIGIFLTTLLGWYQTVFQSRKKFLASMLVSNSVNILRLGVIILVISIGAFTLTSVYFYFQIIAVLVVVVFFFILNRNFSTFLNSAISKDNFKKIFSFGLPVGLSFSLAAVYTKLDQILVFNLIGSREAGIYGLAFRVSAALIFAAAALNTAITPRFASLHPQDFSSYFKKTLFASLGLGFLSILFLLSGPFILPIIFGNKFGDSIIPFQILMVGTIFFTVTVPFSSAILYRFKKSRFPLVVSLCSLLLSWALLNFLIPIYKSSGAAMAVSLIYIFQMIMALSYFIFLNHRASSNLPE